MTVSEGQAGILGANACAPEIPACPFGGIPGPAREGTGDRPIDGARQVAPGRMEVEYVGMPKVRDAVRLAAGVSRMRGASKGGGENLLPCLRHLGR